MSKVKERSINITIYGVCSILMWIILSSYMQSNAATTESEVSTSLKQQKLITNNILKIVNAAFYQKFVLGDWRYEGAQNSGGTINAYIQIPVPLDLTKEIQKSYLRKAICPSSADTKMWNEIDGIPLSIHIYTQGQKNRLYVNCINPLKANRNQSI